MRLFISYPRKDKDETLKLVALLKRGGHEVWIDDGLQVGQSWQDQLRDEILKADAIVLCLTQNWLDSPYCNWEFVVAVEAGKKVVPVLLKKRDDGTLPDIPERISKYQWVDFTTGMDNDVKTQKFLDDVLALGVLIARERGDTARKAAAAAKIQQTTTYIRKNLRLDAATPSRMKVNNPSEVWVQVCLPDSKGFRDQLPRFTRSGDVITKRDVTTGNMLISFPIEIHSGKLLPIKGVIEIKAPDFSINDSLRKLEISPHHDSALIVFMITPLVKRNRSRIQITVTAQDKENASQILGSIMLSTIIQPENSVLERVSWNLIAIALGYFQYTTTKDADFSLMPNENNIRRGSNWRLNIILIIMPAVLGAASIFFTLSQSQRDNILYGLGMISASSTPTAVYTPTPTWLEGASFVENQVRLAYADIKQYEQAVEDYTEAISLDPDNDLLYYGRGLAYRNLGEYEAAIADYDRAIALNENFAYVYWAQASAYYEIKNYPEAIADYRKYEEITGKLESFMLERIQEMEANLTATPAPTATP